MSIQDPLDHASALQIVNDFHSFKVRFLRPPEERPGTIPDALVVMKVSSKKSAGFYVRSAISLLRGLGPGQTSGEAKPSEPAECLRISGLGNAIGVATSVALEIQSRGLADLIRIQTRTCKLPGATSPQILIDLASK